MLILLALIGCSPDELRDDVDAIDLVDVVDAPPAEGELRIATAPDRSDRVRAPIVVAPLPDGEPVLHDCFGLSDREGVLGGAVLNGKSGGTTRNTAGPPPPPAAAAPAEQNRKRPALKPPADNKPMSGADAAGRGVAAPEAEPTVSVPMKLGKKEMKSEDVGGVGQRLDGNNAIDSADEDELREEYATEVAHNEPIRDWGATVHLSNDDSMSLASAQRVLYGVSKGVRLSPSEIRPHELLNYFSFDTAGAPSEQKFSVLGAAEQDGDSLTVSLAVHGANPERQAMDLTVLLDRSCSMQGEGRMDYTKRGLRQLSDNLQRGDRLDMVLFDSGVCTPLEGFVVGRDDPALLSQVIDNLAPTSSTNLDAGLAEAYRIQTSREAADVHRRNRRVMLITDANLNTGNVNEAVVSQVGSAFDDHGIRMTGIGVGRDFNDKMLDMLTEKGKGAYVYLGSEAVVDRIFGPGFDSLTRTIAHDVRFSIDLPNSLAMDRFYGEEASTNAEDIQPINYYADTSQLFLQDLAIRDGIVVRTDPVVMKITYRDAVTGEPATQEMRTTIGALMDGDPHNLRKGKALMAFTDTVMARAMGADTCGDPLDVYRERTSQLGDDAEIAYVSGLVGTMCGVDLSPVVATGVAFKVKVDSDIPIPEVEIECGGRTHSEKLSGADTVARFGSVRPGSCTVRLQGNLPMAAAIEVPEVGGDIRCLVRGGRLACS